VVDGISSTTAWCSWWRVSAGKASPTRARWKKIGKKTSQTRAKRSNPKTHTGSRRLIKIIRPRPAANSFYRQVSKNPNPWCTSSGRHLFHVIDLIDQKWPRLRPGVCRSEQAPANQRPGLAPVPIDQIDRGSWASGRPPGQQALGSSARLCGLGARGPTGHSWRARPIRPGPTQVSRPQRGGWAAGPAGRPMPPGPPFFLFLLPFFIY
jgi:hypothetical protein